MATNIRLKIQYDGTEFNGWQIQQGEPDARTVQGVVEKALYTILKEPVRVIGSGRTDAGVHALGQIANFHTSSPIPTEKWVPALKSVLPEDVAVMNAEMVPCDFHAQYSAIDKTYCYCIWNNTLPNVFLRNYTYHVRGRLEMDDMEQGALFLKGTHNFKSFCSSGSRVKCFERTIKDIGFSRRNGILVFKVIANGFLYKMVRTIVGTLLEIGRGKYPPLWVNEVLKSGHREKAGPTAPARGLFLQEVNYK